MSETHILFHSPCPDGMAAALAAYEHFGDKAKYHPMQYGKALPSIPNGSLIYLVDFSLSHAQLVELANRSDGVIVLDHHKTAQADLEGFANLDDETDDHMYNVDGGPLVKFDMNKSGAVLTWEYFHGSRLAYKPLPHMFRLIQDRDLWRWEFGDDTKAFAAWLSLKPMTLKGYKEALDWLESGEGNYEAAINQGKLLLQLDTQYIERFCSGAMKTNLLGHDIVVVNTSTTVLQSETCARLLEKHPWAKFAGSFCIRNLPVTVDGQTENQETVLWSLRGRGDFDVSEVAKHFGGGGHKSAAGFKMSREELYNTLTFEPTKQECKT